MNKTKVLYLAVIFSLMGTQLVADDYGCLSDNNCCLDDCCTSRCCEGGYNTNKTFFSDLVPFQSGTFLREALFRNDTMEMREDGCGGAFQIVPFGGRTTDRGQEELGQWFGLNHKNRLVVAESPEDLEDADLDSSHFNIDTQEENFKSVISFCPEQKFFGLGLDWKQAICWNDDDTVRWWLEASLPIMYVENCMNLCEYPEAGELGEGTGLDDSPFVGSMAEAFRQSNWRYGKIGGCCNNRCDDNCCDTNGCNTNDCSSTSCNNDCDPMDKWGVADVELKVGYNWVVGSCCHLSSYAGLVIPTGNEPEACYVFEAIIGNNNHFGVMWGAELGYEIWDWDDCMLYGKVNFDSRYLFCSEERRSFDLVGKPWSRYMEMYASKEDAATASNNNDPAAGTSGINLMTRCVDVTPAFQFNLNNALVFEGCCWMFELGHTLYARQGEIICPNWQEGPALKHELGEGRTTIARNVKNRFTNELFEVEDYDKAVIKRCDIDWNSGAHPGVIAHSIYGAIGYNWDDCEYPTVLSIGGAWNFSQGNAAMHRWTLWGKLGISV